MSVAAIFLGTASVNEGRISCRGFYRIAAVEKLFLLENLYVGRWIIYTIFVIKHIKSQLSLEK